MHTHLLLQMHHLLVDRRIQQVLRCRFPVLLQLRDITLMNVFLRMYLFLKPFILPYLIIEITLQLIIANIQLRKSLFQLLQVIYGSFILIF